MPFKCSSNWPMPARIIMSFIGMVEDMIIAGGAGIIMIFAMYLFNGFTWANLM